MTEDWPEPSPQTLATAVVGLEEITSDTMHCQSVGGIRSVKTNETDVMTVRQSLESEE
jgi:hypothetical protein